MSWSPSPRASRLAIALFFFADGVVVGSFASRLPAIQHATGVTSSRLGLALFASSVGALVAMPVAGRLCDRIGSRAVSLAVLLLACGALVLTSVAGSLAALAGALLCFGAGFGSLNVSINAQALMLERRYERPILSSFHAAFSAGGLTGAALGALAAGLAVGPRAHFAVVAIVLLSVGAAAGPALLPGRDPRGGSSRAFRLPRAIVLLGAAAFCCMLVEGSAADWSAVYLTHSAGASQAVAALGYTSFSLAMVGSRLLGDRANERLGPHALVRGAGLLVACGLAAALLIGSAPAGIAGFAAMGIGLGGVIPVLFRAAGGVVGISASTGIAAVSTIGWLGFLAGPPAIGLASAVVGLRAALGIAVLAALVLARLAPRDTGRPARAAQPVSESSVA